MAFVNFATREITAKIVYYGPGLGGKTTSLQYIHNGLPGDNRGKMISLATEEDRTIYFDFLPLNLGKIQDFAVRVQLYTVPGQVRYNATRKLVLRGADGLVFVADSQKHKKLSNLESFHNMEENLREHGKDLKDLPHILQFNKIDLPNRMSAQDLNTLLNKYNVPFFETCATLGIGILDALKSITKLVFNDLGKKALLQKKTKTGSGPNAGAPAAIATENQNPAAPVPASLPPAAAPAPAAPHPSYYQESYSAVEVPIQPAVEPPPEIIESKVEARQEPDTFAAIEPVSDESLEEVEGSSEIDFEEVSPNDLVYEDEYPTNLLEKRADATVEGFSYDELLDGPAEFKSLIERFEHQITEGQNNLALLSARAAYTTLINELFPREYFVDGNEISIMFALNMKFKRYRRFRRLLDSETIRTPDLLFLHHFLCDLYLSIREL
jgi:signal recognition particle receptor subunit beta